MLVSPYPRCILFDGENISFGAIYMCVYVCVCVVLVYPLKSRENTVASR